MVEAEGHTPLKIVALSWHAYSDAIEKLGKRSRLVWIAWRTVRISVSLGAALLIPYLFEYAKGAHLFAGIGGIGSVIVLVLLGVAWLIEELRKL